jgi:hypothetical protein
MTCLTKRQEKTYGPKTFTEDGEEFCITVLVRYDDRCGNGHNTFSITANIDRKRRGRWEEYAGGCCHDDIARFFPDLKPFIKWHLVSSDGPLHYKSNTCYHAGDRDAWGLRKGEKRQIRHGGTGLLAWRLATEDGRAATVDGIPQYVDAEEQPPAPLPGLIYAPWCRVGEGKAPDLDAARRSAIWPDATDQDLTAPGLAERLEARLPALIAEFKRYVESLGFVF